MKKIHKKQLNLGLSILTILIVVFMFFPFVWCFFLSFKDNNSIFNYPFSLPEKFDFSLYVETFRIVKLGILFRNTLIVTLTSVIIATILVFCAAFAIVRLRGKNYKFSNFFHIFFIGGMAVPVFSILYPLYLVNLNIGQIVPALGLDSLTGLIMPYVAIQIPMSTVIFVGGLKSIPVELEEAAIIDGANLFDIIFRIDLPIISPVVVCVFIFQVLGIWNEFPIASIMINNSKYFTLPLAVSFFRLQYTADYGAMLRAALMIMAPQMIFYAIFQRQIMDGMATAGLKG